MVGVTGSHADHGQRLIHLKEGMSTFFLVLSSGWKLFDSLIFFKITARR
jgi:hypothetical protein